VALVAAGVRQPEEAAAPDVAAVVALLRGAERAVAVVVLPQAERAVAAAVRLRAAGPVSEVLRQAVQGAQGVLPSAAAWAAPLSTRLRGDRLAPSPPVRSARAKESLRIARP
jgi:hypothetical protein